MMRIRLSHKGRGVKGMRFLVRWKDGNSETWEPFANLNGNVKFKEYVTAHKEEMKDVDTKMMKS